MRRAVRKSVMGQRGFTLIEMLVVIAVMGVLAAVVVPNVTSFIGSGQTQGANTELDIVQTAMDSMMVDKGLTSVPAVTTATSAMASFPDDTNHLYPNYLRKDFTKGTYTCTADGKVTQAAKGY